MWKVQKWLESFRNGEKGAEMVQKVLKWRKGTEIMWKEQKERENLRKLRKGLCIKLKCPSSDKPQTQFPNPVAGVMMYLNINKPFTDIFIKYIFNVRSESGLRHAHWLVQWLNKESLKS
jgi:hypothetical protein